jgi:hypothetical protein
LTTETQNETLYDFPTRMAPHHRLTHPRRCRNLPRSRPPTWLLWT